MRYSTYWTAQRLLVRTRLKFVDFTRFVRSLASESPTIFAVATGSNKAAISVIRVSGDKVPDLLRCMIASKRLPEPRKAAYTKLLHPRDGTVLDKCIVLWFPKPNSVTGEDYCELHLHGGIAVQSAVVSALRAANQKMRLAEPGEFAKRSFLNGKLDLIEVEGLADLINAETEQQRKQALRQLDGELSRLYISWRQQLLTCLANLEAYIDFADEEQIDADVLDRVRSGASQLRAAILAHLNDARRGERLRAGVKLVIVGAPNGGKSSLLNLFAQRDAAIVSPIPGTTRDTIEVSLNLGGYAVQLVDTAGLRQRPRNDGSIAFELEAEGMRRAYRNWCVADLLFVVIDACNLVQHFDGQLELLTSVRLFEHLEAHARSLLAIGAGLQVQPSAVESEFAKLCKVFILNKSDLLSVTQRRSLSVLLSETPQANANASLISCVTCDGFQALMLNVQQCLARLCGSGEPHEPICLTQARHRVHLQDCLAALDAFANALQLNDAVKADSLAEATDSHVYPDHVYVEGAEHLRHALRHLGKMTGHVSTDELLSLIFRQFCIGK